MNEIYLINAINYEMEQLGNTDVSVKNIRFFTKENRLFAMADVTYTWYVNSWDKKVHHKDMIFALVDEKENRWLSPIFG